jgi:catechol 2,3-dioxygenase-like lactoylglutathione lyase family enzyme
MNRTVRFYEEAFDAKVLGEVLPREDHPWMKIVDIGGGGQLNIFEATAEEIIGERRRQGHRGAVDHFALAVNSKSTLEKVGERLRAAGAQEVGDIQQFGPNLLSVFFRDPDGMELEVCCQTG